jgi:hypothetical protein
MVRFGADTASVPGWRRQATGCIGDGRPRPPKGEESALYLERPPKGRPARVGISERSLGVAEAHGSFIGGPGRRRDDEAPEPVPGC